MFRLNKGLFNLVGPCYLMQCRFDWLYALYAVQLQGVADNINLPLNEAT